MKRLILAACALIALCSVAAQAAEADRKPSSIPTAVGDLVCGVPNHNMVPTLDGSSINWITGIIDDVGGQIHWNPYALGGGLRFFWPTAGNGGGASSGGVYSILAAGDIIGPSSTFITQISAAATADWHLGANGYLGFNFDCPAGTCYGYAHLISAAPAGFPLTLADYCVDLSGDAITILTNYTVTPTIGTGHGAITPATAQPVNKNATIAFTLAADSGFHIGSVGGTCGGTLAGSVYTTLPITADCTVIANFAVGDTGDRVCRAPNRNMVASFDGSSINWITGDIDDSGGQIHWNPYEFSSELRFFWPPTGNGGGVASGGVYSVLAPGDIIGPSSTFTRLSAGLATADWRGGANGYMGFNFDCPAGTCYGYAHLDSTAPSGFPLTLVDYCYDKSGAAITVSRTVFSDGFEGDDRNVVTGVINLPLINSLDGSAFNFLTGSLHAYDVGVVDHINLYNIGSGMRVYWYADVSGIVGVGGVPDSGGVEYAVLQVGDVIGPASTIRSASIPMANWIGGANGYIGVAFENTDTGQLNYGYIHMTTTGPLGYPAQLLKYGYNKAGEAITIPSP